MSHYECLALTEEERTFLWNATEATYVAHGHQWTADTHRIALALVKRLKDLKYPGAVGTP